HQFFLAEHDTVRENVADGLLYAGVRAAERQRRADEAIEQVGLAHRATFKPTKLSGGERQRVAIDRALVGRPAIVLADEPTANLGLRARPLRAALSALGIAIGTAAIVGVLGLSSSSQAGLIAEINRLGTNLLTIETGQSLTGAPAQLPREAPARITLLHNVQQVAHTALIKNAYVYRSSIVPVAE